MVLLSHEWPLFVQLCPSGLPKYLDHGLFLAPNKCPRYGFPQCIMDYLGSQNKCFQPIFRPF